LQPDYQGLLSTVFSVSVGLPYTKTMGIVTLHLRWFFGIGSYEYVVIAKKNSKSRKSCLLQDAGSAQGWAKHRYIRADVDRRSPHPPKFSNPPASLLSDWSSELTGPWPIITGCGTHTAVTMMLPRSPPLVAPIRFSLSYSRTGVSDRAPDLECR